MRDVEADNERRQWDYTPVAIVGPLRFGMRHQQVCQALDTAPIAISHDPVARTCPDAWFCELGVTTYYADSKLIAVAVDAFMGPQVTLAGMPLVGQVPSRLEDWLCDYAESQGQELWYTYEGCIGSPGLGLLMRVQRVGDLALTRPVFMIREWVHGGWDLVPLSEFGKL